MDVYQPCPCGSGKKLKFCCLSILGEMEKVVRYFENNQLRMAEQALEALRKSHPDVPWAATMEASMRLEQGQPDAAAKILRSLLKSHPEHEFAMLLLTMAILSTDGFKAAKKGMYWCVQKSLKQHPDSISGLFRQAADVLLNENHYFAARELLALAFRTATDSTRKETFDSLLDFDGQDEVPYLMRGAHPLPTWTPDEGHEKEYRRAVRMAHLGLFEPATELFLKLAQAHPETPVLWHATGLCAAWDAEELQAAEYLRKAGKLYEDIGQAVECETLALLFQAYYSETAVKRMSHMASIEGGSRLVERLEQHPRFHKRPGFGGEGPDSPTVVFTLLDRELTEEADSAEPSVPPRVLALISISRPHVDIPNLNDPAILFNFLWISGESFKSLMKEAAPEFELVQIIEERCFGIDPEMWIRIHPADTFWSVAPNSQQATKVGRDQEILERRILEEWLDQPLQELGGRTPRELASDPAGRTQALAAVYTLDCLALRGHITLDIERIAHALNLELLPPLHVEPDSALNTLTTMQLHRLPCEALTDEQLAICVNRELVIDHPRHLRRFLNAALERPGCLDLLEVPRVCAALARLELGEGNEEAARRCLATGRQHVSNQLEEGERFIETLRWELMELGVWLPYRDIAYGPELLERFCRQYLHKVPEIRRILEQLLDGTRRTDLLPVISDAGQRSVEGMWTPPSAEPEQPERKLWLPGQR